VPTVEKAWREGGRRVQRLATPSPHQYHTSCSESDEMFTACPEEVKLTSCLLLRFHVSAFRLEFMF